MTYDEAFANLAPDKRRSTSMTEPDTNAASERKMNNTPYPNTPYERIYLQYYGSEKPSEGPAMEVSWCDEKIHEHDVEYVKLESVAKLIEERAKEFEGLPVTEMELTRLAGEIRDGAHHEGRE